MTTPGKHDAYVSPRVAADLCGIPTGRVLSLMATKAIRPVIVQGQRLVSLMEVERSIGEEGERGHSA
jgi:hypothetical protein